MVAEVVAVSEVTAVLEVLAVLEELAVMETTPYIVADIVVLLMVVLHITLGIVPEVMVDKVDMVDTIRAIISHFSIIIVITYVIPA